MLEKEIERAGIPTAQICTIVPIAQTVRANRIVKAIAIPHPVGVLGKSKEEENIRTMVVKHAIEAITSPVDTQLVIE